MLPFRDHNRTRIVPIATIIIIGINVVVWLYEVSLQASGQLDIFINTWAVVPAQLLNNPGGEWLTVLAAMFMHSSWMHIIGNMVYLWIFGDNIEDVLGSLLYVVFYLACGLVATVAQVAVGPFSQVPNLGASGAIAGVLGAYLLLFPQERIDTLIFLGWFIRIVQLPALVVLGFWFVLQLFQGVGSLNVTTQGGGVAYFAHIGGFVAGLGLMALYRALGGATHRRGEYRW
jgi:membrane associated rhomboid family serine protease